MKQELSLYTFSIVCGIFFLNGLAHRFGWYEGYWWFDNLMHALGGLFVAFLGAQIVMNKQLKGSLSRSLLFFVFTIGVLWEAYEYGVQLFFPFETIAAPLDSLQDLALDMFGGVIGIYFVSLLQTKYNRKNGEQKNT